MSLKSILTLSLTFYLISFSYSSRAQTIPDSIGFFIYDDAVADDIEGGNWSGGLLDFESTDSPNNGTNCIRWEDANLFGQVNFGFQTPRDLSYLVDNNYAVDLLVRGTNNDIWFDIRFLDTDEGPADHPWRIRATLNQNHGPWDGRWHHVHIPLKEMGEQGSWDDNMWFPPVGEFDWTKVNQLQIVADRDSLIGRTLWFDNIQITELDTAQIYDHSVFGDITSLENTAVDIQFEVFPNPTSDFITIKTRNQDIFNFALKSINGKVLLQDIFSQEKKINISHIPKGIYWLKIKKGNTPIKIQQIIKQ